MSCCESLTDLLPVLSVLMLTTWSYYTYVIELCIHIIKEESVTKESFYLIVYHMLLFMYLWTYFKVMFSDIAVVPNEFKVSRELYKAIKEADTDEEKNILLEDFCQQRDLAVVTRTEEGYIRFCNKCKVIKPDRAHHCSVCGTCILKMDHHCPWVNNCIGFSNYKFFVQFLCYAAVYCIFFAATTLEYFIKYWAQPTKKYSQLHVVVGFIATCALAIVLFSFSCYHLSLIARNETTLEVMKEPTFYDHNGNLTFDIGVCENYEEIFGDNCCLWLIPVQGECGDGVRFPIRYMS